MYSLNKIWEELISAKLVERLEVNGIRRISVIGNLVEYKSSLELDTNDKAIKHPNYIEVQTWRKRHQKFMTIGTVDRMGQFKANCSATFPNEYGYGDYFRINLPVLTILNYPPTIFFRFKDGNGKWEIIAKISYTRADKLSSPYQSNTGKDLAIPVRGCESIVK